MGHKVNPNGFRLGIIKKWDSIWYSNKFDFSKNIKNDFIIRDFIEKELPNNFISKIIIERLINNIKISIYTSRPGLIIGKNGNDINKLKEKLTKITKIQTQLNILEVKKPELDSKLISKYISSQIEKRIHFRKIIKKVIQNTIKSNLCEGIKIQISGRLNGIEIARKELFKEGRIPLHTLRADIDFSSYIARTTYGIIGIKVWVFKGEIF